MKYVIVLALLVVCVVSTKSTIDDIVEKKKDVIFLEEEAAEQQQRQRDQNGGAANCPNDCSGHGQCRHKCHCDPAYYGDDCSIRVQPVVVGDIQTGTLEPRSWVYFSYTLLEPGTQVTFTVEEPEEGDCDIYLRLNKRPTRRHFDHKDITLEKHVDIEVTSEDPRGTWYAGIFGFQECHYTLTVHHPALPCPDGCNAHGQCVDAKCVCNPGFGGPTCSFSNVGLTIGVPVQDTVALNDWKYFNFQIPDTHSQFTIEMDADHDADLYGALDHFPDSFSWDYLNSSVPDGTAHDVSTITLQDADPGLYYFGVFGYEASTFQIKITTSSFVGNVCANECSGATHGTCRSGECSCIMGSYTGDKCQFASNDLTDGQQTGYVDEDEWNYYTVNTFTSSDVDIVITQQGADADCDLYVNRGSYPDRQNFTQAHLGFESTFRLAIEDAGQETYYIGVFGWKQCGYTIEVGDPVAGCGCMNGGMCTDSGECQCVGNFGGPKCDTPVIVLTPGQPVSSSVKQNMWKYFKVPSAASHSYTFTMHENDHPGMLWFYVNNRDTPTLDFYDVKENGATQPHFINLQFEHALDNEFYIGVYGSPYIADATLDYQFSVDVWVFPETTGRK